MKIINMTMLLAAMNFMPINAKAQNKDVQRIEFEFRAGLTTPLGSYHGGSAQTGAALGMEGRYNLKGAPCDCGLMLDLTTARRGFEPMDRKDLDIWQSNRTLALAAIGNYNFQQGRNINPFIGVAIGVAVNDVVGDKIYPSKGTSLFFSPRIGIELIHHLRLTVSSNFSRKGYNNLQFSLGLVVGGRPKKNDIL